MAKVRRVVRRLPPRRDFFDEHQWPVNSALVVLAGFLVGMAIALLRFDDPRWVYNAWTTIIAAPILVAVALVALHFVGHRVLRRTMQFCAVISLVLHLLFMLGALQVKLFQRVQETRSVADHTRQREVVVPEYFRPQDQDREQREFERPVETPNPEPTPDQPAERNDPQPSALVERTPDVLTPDPESKPTPQVNPQRREAELTVPRRSPDSAQLSRHEASSQSRPRTSSASETQPASSATAARKLDARQAAASRASSPKSAERSAPPTNSEPANPTRATNASPTARAAARSADQQASQLAAPALPRRSATPDATPRAESASDLPSSVAQQTSPQSLEPANTAAVERQTTSPRTTERASAEPEAPLERSEVSRQSPLDQLPELAQSPQPTPNRQPRMTDRAPAATTVEGIEAQQAPAALQLTARETPEMARDNRTNVARAAASEPNSRPTVASLALDRREASGAPADQATAAPTPAPAPTRSSARGVQTQATPAELAASNSGMADPQGALAPMALANDPRRSTPAESSATRQMGQSAAAAAGRPEAALANSSRAAATTTESSQGPASPSPSRSNVRTDQVAARMADSPQSQQPSPAAVADGSLRPDSGSISRQPAASPAQPTAVGATSVDLASRSATSGQPATARQASALPQNTPPTDAMVGRATLNATAGAIAAAEPELRLARAASQGASSAADLSPAALALDRSLEGQAGGGNERNLASSSPAGESPAPIPSAAARRAEATQDTDLGPALAPSAPAAVARGIASAATPEAARQAQVVDDAQLAGAGNPTQETLSSSAATQLNKANATPADSTGAAGDLAIDTGATQIVPSAGSGRASGGGQPEINVRTPGDEVGRSELAGGAMATATAAINPTAQLPTAGGGQPQPALAANPSATERQPAAAGGMPAAGEPNLLAGGPLASETPGAPAAQRAAGAAGEASELMAAAAGEEDEEERERQRQQALRMARNDLGGGVPQSRLDPAAELTAGELASGGRAAGQSPAITPALGALAGPTRDAQPAGGMAAVAAATAQEVTPGSGQPLLARAESADGAPGASVAGGGAASPGRQASRPLFAARVPDDMLRAAGRPDSSGAEQGSPLAAQGSTVERSASGADGPITARKAGAIGAAETAREQTALAGARRADGSLESALTAVGPAGGVSRQSSQLSPEAWAEITSPGQLTVGDDESGATQDGSGLAAAPTETRRQQAEAGGGNPLEIDAQAGAGGLAASELNRAGVGAAQALSDQGDAVLTPQRFMRQELGGRPGAASGVVAIEPFQRRNGRAEGTDDGGGRGRPGPQTERAIELGLAFLARHQLNDGSWSLAGFDPEPIVIQSDGAATALALLAFQGAGYHHRDFRYATNVQTGLDFLVAHQDQEGAIVVEAGPSNAYVKLYTHALAAIALCEAYGMTQDPELREPAQKAIDYIVASQDTQRGGWRYEASQDSDTSVTGWMTMALKSGELARLKVPAEAFARIQRWLDSAQASADQPFLFRYNPNAPNTAQEVLGRTPSKAMSAVGLLMRMYLGWRRDNARLRQGADYLLDHLPSMGVLREEPYKKNRDTYYWYYATQVMFHVGGEHWRRWNEALHSLLLQTQVQDGALAGSWDPRLPVPDRWGMRVGRLYVTTMNLLSLEVYYRHLPLYDAAAK